jgi:hypothetical protein
MKERIKELDAQLAAAHLTVGPLNSGLDGTRIDAVTLRLMELRASIELAQQIEYLTKAIRDVELVLRAKL